MAISRQKKEEVLSKVEGVAKDAKTIVFANFKRLPVAQVTEMRRGLRAQGVGYMVAKKSLVRRALINSSVAGEMPEIVGEFALAYGTDELAPARELAVFVKKFPEQLTFAGGVFGGRFVDGAEIKAIAAIPPLQTLRGMFVNIINSPIQRFAVVLNEVAKSKE